MIQERKELCYVKCKNTCIKTFHPFYIYEMSLMNSFSLSLFLMIDLFFSWINSSSTMIDTNERAWSNRFWRSSKIMWLLNFSYLVLRNIRSSTEFKPWELSPYWVDTGLIGVDNFKSKLSATSWSMSTCNKWWEYGGP